MMVSARSFTLFSGISQPIKKGRMRYLAQANVMIDADELFSTSNNIQVYRNDIIDPSTSTQEFFL